MGSGRSRGSRATARFQQSDNGDEQSGLRAMEQVNIVGIAINHAPKQRGLNQTEEGRRMQAKEIRKANSQKKQKGEQEPNHKQKKGGCREEGRKTGEGEGEDRRVRP